MKPKNYLLAGLAVVLAGCTITVRDRDLPESWRIEGERDGRPRPEWVDGRSINNCPVFILPEVRVLPATPHEQFRRLPKDAQVAREQMLLDHIQDLRQHIKDSKSDLMDKYTAYLQQCVMVTKQK